MPAPDDTAALLPGPPGTVAPAPPGTVAPDPRGVVAPGPRGVVAPGPPGAGPPGVVAPGPRGAAFSADASVPHPARVYGYWLGGKDHFPADRKVAEEIADYRPQVVAGARANREFLVRAVEYLAREAGIRQFLDIGAGLPAPAATHEVAQAIAPQSRVLYVDNDPLVLAYARAALAGGTGQGTVACAAADLRDPASVLARAAGPLDLSRPVAVLLLAVLHFIPEAAGPAGIVAALARGLPPGSYLAISHLTADFAPEQVGPAVAAYNTLIPTPVTARTHGQVSRLFGDLPLVAPGVVPVSGWRPRPFDALPRPADLYAGLARTAQARTAQAGTAQAGTAQAGTAQARTFPGRRP